MQKFIDFVVKYKEYITFTALIVISLSLISLGSVNKIGGFRTVVIGGIGWFQNIFSFIPNPAALKNENEALRELNLQLSTEVARMRNALIENKNLREMLELKKKLDVSFSIAEVTGRSTIEMRSYLTIDRGRTSGIEDGMSVRNDAGLVGLVIGASDNYALIETINNRDVKIASKVQRNAIPGILIWDGGQDFLLRDVPKSFDVKPGDIIVTSNYSNRYPSDVPIGQVTKAQEEQGELFLKIVVKPFVNYSTLEQVFVLKYIPNSERNILMKEIDEKLKLRKLTSEKEEKLQSREKKKQPKEETKVKGRHR